MIQKNGSKRTSFLIGPFVIKIPHVRMIRGFILGKLSLLAGGGKNRQYIQRDVGFCATALQVGANCNYQEYQTYQKIRKGFLAKSYLCWFGGYVLVAERLTGKSLDGWDVVKLLRKLPEDRAMRVNRGDIEAHSFFNGDWILTERGVVILDYGGRGINNDFKMDATTQEFLIANKDHLEKLMKAYCENTP